MNYEKANPEKAYIVKLTRRLSMSNLKRTLRRVKPKKGMEKLETQQVSH